MVPTPTPPGSKSARAGNTVNVTSRASNVAEARFESIKSFEVLPHDFTIEGGELTSTLKVRRTVVAKKYAAAIDRLYTK